MELLSFQISTFTVAFPRAKATKTTYFICHLSKTHVCLMYINVSPVDTWPFLLYSVTRDLQKA